MIARQMTTKAGNTYPGVVTAKLNKISGSAKSIFYNFVSSSFCFGNNITGITISVDRIRWLSRLE